MTGAIVPLDRDNLPVTKRMKLVSLRRKTQFRLLMPANANAHLLGVTISRSPHASFGRGPSAIRFPRGIGIRSSEIIIVHSVTHVPGVNDVCQVVVENERKTEEEEWSLGLTSRQLYENPLCSSRMKITAR